MYRDDLIEVIRSLLTRKGIQWVDIKFLSEDIVDEILDNFILMEKE